MCVWRVSVISCAQTDLTYTCILPPDVTYMHMATVTTEAPSGAPAIHHKIL